MVAILADQLKLFMRNGDNINAFLISRLIDLKAVETAPLMKQAFAADLVDTNVVGDWEDVQVKLGFLSKRKTPYPRAVWPLIDPRELAPRTPVIQTNPNSRQARRKAEREARKKK